MAILTTFAVGLGTTSCGDSSANVAGFNASDLAQLQASAGDSQVGTVGTVLSTPLIVHAVSPGGQSVGGVSVQWTFSSGGGSTTVDGAFTQDLTTTTDNTGQTSVYWQLGTTAGDQVASATLLTTNQKGSSSPIKFHSHGNAGNPNNVLVSPDSVILAGGDSAALTATVSDRWGNTISGATVAWSSSDSSVASVRSDGTVTGRTKGKATITATDGKVKGTASVTVPATTSATLPNASITVTPDSVSLASIGATTQLSAVAKDSLGNTMSNPGFSWRSLASSIASVSGSGLVTAKAVGATLVIATAACCTGADTAMVAVSQVAARVTINPDSLSLQVGKSSQLSATVFDANNNVIAGAPVTWSSSNDSVASVDSTGLVLAKAAGTATITATDGKAAGTASVRASTSPTLPNATITLTPDSVSLTSIGATAQLSAAAKDSLGNTMSNPGFSWRSLASSIASVSNSGMVTAKAVGATMIIVTAACCTGTDTAMVAVSQVPSTVVVSPSSVSDLAPGATQQFTATVKDSNGVTISGASVSWSSGNTAVATVNGSGLATGVAAGTTNVQALSGSKTGSASLTVVAPTSGQTVLLYEDFEDNNFAGRGWYDNTALTTTATVAESGNRSLEAHFLQGATTPTYGPGARHLFTPSETVYLSYWIKYSDNWVGSGQPYHPHEFYFITNEDDPYVGPNFTHLIVDVEHNYQNGGIPTLAMGDDANVDTNHIGEDLTNITEDRAAAGCNGNTDGYATECYSIGGGLYANGKIWRAGQPYFMPSPGPGYKGDWHHVEAYFKLNSIVNGKGVTDGIARYWFDGQLVIDHTNVLFRTGAHPNMKFNQFMIAFYIGDGSPVDQTAWVDNLTVATGR